MEMAGVLSDPEAGLAYLLLEASSPRCWTEVRMLGRGTEATDENENLFGLDLNY